MSKTLLIIESPGKRKKLEAILGASYTVRASFGHIRDLPEKEIGVQGPDYQPRYVVPDKRSREAIDALKKAASEADRVLLATDPDREGEAIAWHVAEALKLKDRLRVAYQAITPKDVTAAVANPRALDMDLVRAQEARRVLDRLVGYEVSSALSDKAGQRLSAGRVQSPAVRLVVDRERAIREFKSTTHYGAELHFTGPWKAGWDTKPHLAHGAEYLLLQPLAQEAATVRDVRVTDFADTQAKAPPPPPFTTSTLQQRAQTALKFKPKHTMKIAQALYEQGAITYLRTDSPNLSEEAIADIAAYARANNLPLVDTPRRWKAKGNAQEAHEAIRPTHVDQVSAGETDDEKALYRLIWSRAVASQLVDALFAVRTATLEGLAPLSDGKHPVFVGRGRTLTEKGWKVIYDEPDESDDKDDDSDAANPVPLYQVGAELRADSGKVLTKATKAPPRYTLASLVKELEANGIGRPATYASILDNIMAREYIAEDKKGQLSATPTGEKVVDALAGTFGFIELDYTRELENELDEIAEGKKPYRDVVSTAHSLLSNEIRKLGPSHVHPCPDCSKPLRRRTGKTGFFWGCSGYPDCKLTLPDSDGKPGPRETKNVQAPHSTSQYKCTKCEKPLQRKTKSKKDDPKGKGYDFYGCTGWPTCKQTYQVDPQGQPVFDSKS